MMIINHLAQVKILMSRGGHQPATRLGTEQFVAMKGYTGG